MTQAYILYTRKVLEPSFIIFLPNFSCQRLCQREKEIEKMCVCVLKYNMVVYIKKDEINVRQTKDYERD